MRAVVTRKCSICKEAINITDSNEDFFIISKKGSNSYTHSKCYINHYTSPKRRKPKTLEECNAFIEECKIQNNDITKEKYIMDELYSFIFDMYEISYLPNYFYIKMDSVYKGTYKNLNKPVPPEDLLDMWKQKKNYLEKVYEQNRKKGTDIEGINRVNYDLAILLSKYDSYLKWKEQQRIAVAEIEDQKKRNIEKIEFKDVVRPQRTTKNTDRIDINSMLDEI